jgi:hypothetical protein
MAAHDGLPTNRRWRLAVLACLLIAPVSIGRPAVAQQGPILRQYTVTIVLPNQPRENLLLRYQLHVAPMQATRTGQPRRPWKGVFIDSRRCNWRYRAMVRRRLIVRPQSRFRSALSRYSGRVIDVANKPGIERGDCNPEQIRAIAQRETAQALRAARRPTVGAQIDADARRLRQLLQSLIPNATVGIRPL